MAKHARSTIRRQGFYLPAIALLCCCTLAGLASNAHSIETDEVERLLSKRLHSALTERYPQGRFSITPAPVTSAVHNRQCDQLSLDMPKQNLFGRVSVRVSCASPTPWAMYAQATVDLRLPVVVAKQVIPRGELITPAAIDILFKPAAQVRSHALTRIKQAAGKQARTTLRGGQVVNASHITVPQAVARGDRVQIQSLAGRVRISTAGVALESGKVGEQIAVRNESSKRTIHPWILAPGSVGTRPPRLASK